MKRYLEGLSNLILTDYLEFRWYVNGKHRLTARLADVTSTKKIKTAKNGINEVTELLTAFLNTQVPTLANPKELATKMAAIARLIRDALNRAFKQETKSGSLHQQFRGFQKVLLHDLTEEQFADMYAQTICYGLFAARCNMKGSAIFTREHAAFNLPKTNPFLRKLFSHIAGPDLDERIVWAVDDLAELLNRAEINEILKDFGERTGREDPVVHFYETFLIAYDPKIRETRGVYYTPKPVVSYIVRSVDHILKKDFSLVNGLADSSKIEIKKNQGKEVVKTHKVLILDPATGTGTFLYEVINHIFDSFGKNKGMWSAYVSEHLLPRLFGFELLMAPYSVAHLKLGLQLGETDYDFKKNERLGVYLTNSLDEVLQLKSEDPFSHWLIDEANAASEIKQDAPVMVIIGNPPYSGHSVNTGKWIINLLHGMDTHTGKKSSNYFEVNGEPLGERNPKYLNDDYVKFIRFAQWRIEQTGYGIMAFITNHGYLDNPTFRGMRQSLMEAFDSIYVLDLHGNSKKKERNPSGKEDKNVFDIQQGVAIGIFVKQGIGQKKAATVHHAHLWGVRELYIRDRDDKEPQGKGKLVGGKYHWLWKNNVSTTMWTEIQPMSPFYFFIPLDTDLSAEYEQGWKITDIMPLNSTGVKTHRDGFVVAFSLPELKKRIEDFRNLDLTDEEIIEQYGLRDTSDWKLGRKRRALAVQANWKEYFVTHFYRPFDFRQYYHNEDLVDRPRQEVMYHMLAGKNLGLITTRQTKEKWDVHTSRFTIDHKSLAAYDTNSLFPLYIYPEQIKGPLFESGKLTNSTGRRQPNFAPSFIGNFAEKLTMDFIRDGKGDLVKTFGPEDVFNYMYAVFHSPVYRSRYAEFLKTDFPRLPITLNADLLRSLCQLGAELAALHLMEKHVRSITSYPMPGDNTVETVRYTEPGQGADKGRVWINKLQFFEGVPPEVWGFHVGGYQVCQKWLKDRKGRQLTYDELAHYQHIISALSETIRLMAEIDEAIEDLGGWPIQ